MERAHDDTLAQRARRHRRFFDLQQLHQRLETMAPGPVVACRSAGTPRALSAEASRPMSAAPRPRKPVRVTRFALAGPSVPSARRSEDTGSYWSSNASDAMARAVPDAKTTVRG